MSFNYDKVHLYVPTSQNGGVGQGNIWAHGRTDRQIYLIEQADRLSGIDTTHPTGLEFSRIRIELEL